MKRAFDSTFDNESVINSINSDYTFDSKKKFLTSYVNEEDCNNTGQILNDVELTSQFAITDIQNSSNNSAFAEWFSKNYLVSNWRLWFSNAGLPGPPSTNNLIEYYNRFGCHFHVAQGYKKNSSRITTKVKDNEKTGEHSS